MIDRCKITDNFQHISEMYENFVSRAGFKPTSPSILFGCDIDFTIGTPMLHVDTCQLTVVSRSNTANARDIFLLRNLAKS